MADHVTVFPNPDPPLLEIADKVDELEEAEAAAEQGGTDRTIARDARLAELKLLMQREVLYVQLVTSGNPEQVAMAGMDTQDDPVKWPRPDKVSKLEVNPGGNPGTVRLVAKRPNYKRMYVFQRYVEGGVITVPAEDGGPDTLHTEEGRWETIAVQGRGRFLLEGLVSGGHYRFRVAAVNAAGMGDYSDEVTCVAR